MTDLTLLSLNALVSILFVPSAITERQSWMLPFRVTTTYQDKKGKTKTEKYNMDFSEWKKLKKGEEIELKINFNGFAEINSKD